MVLKLTYPSIFKSFDDERIIYNYPKHMIHTLNKYITYQIYSKKLNIINEFDHKCHSINYININHLSFIHHHKKING
jgi:hypothetical protein